MTPQTQFTWFLYIIRCADNTLYTGITIDVEARFATHQSQTSRSAKYLRGREPLTLVFQVPIGSKSKASRAEYYVKRLSKQNKEKLIQGQLNIDELMPS